MNVTEAAQVVSAHPGAAEQGQQYLQQILTRSATDRAFRQRLLTDSRGALQELYGVNLPDSVNLHFVENTADATIVLPDPVDPAAELSADELEAVAGGVTPVSVAGAYYGSLLLVGATAALAVAVGQCFDGQ